MASPTPLHALPGGRYVHELERQRAAHPTPPTQLVLCCSEPDGGREPGWRRAMRPAYFLETPGAEVEGAGVREALHHAVRELRVDELLLVVHSHCAHRDEGAAAAPGRGEEGSFLERLRAARARARAGRRAAARQVREAVRCLGDDPVLGSVALAAFVHVPESNLLLAYDRKRDEFEALL